MEEFEYDNIGLPTKYRNKTLTWDKRNQLASYNGVTYTYDGSGMRLTKGSKVYEYDGDTLLSETNGNEVIKFIYGISGLIGFLYNGTPYYYVRNMLGDVKSIKDANGTIVAEYKYDAWGKCTIASQTGLYLGTKNPIRYRGYFYDEETGLYYLQTRYYDPDIGRFISPDSTKYLDPETLGGLNLYAYCMNDPINKYDPSGHFAITLTTLLIGGLIAGGFGAGIGLGTAIYKDVKEDGVWFNGDWTDYVGRTLGGFVAGFGVGICTVLGAGVGAAALGGTTATLFTSTGLTLSLGSALGIGIGVAFVTGMAGYAVRAGISRSEDFKVHNMFIEGGFNAVSGALSVLGGYLGGMAEVHNTVFTKLLSQKGDFWLRLLVENVFNAGFKLTSAFIKPYFMI